MRCESTAQTAGAQPLPAVLPAIVCIDLSRYVQNFEVKNQGRGGCPGSRSLPITTQRALGHHWAHVHIKSGAKKPT